MAGKTMSVFPIVMADPVQVAVRSVCVARFRPAADAAIFSRIVERFASAACSMAHSRGLRSSMELDRKDRVK